MSNKNGKKFRKSKKDRMIFGVCGGIANYFGIDPVWIRLVLAIAIIFKGVGLGIYLILALVMQTEE